MAVSRRSFLKSAAAVTAATASAGTVQSVLGKPVATTAGTSLNKWRGRVAINFNKDAVTDYAKKTVNSEKIATMVDETIMQLSGKETVGDAWKEIFPATLTPTSKIAIKTNFYALSICVPPEVLLAMVTGLRKMVIDGAAFTGDITIYEANTSNGFEQAGYNAAAFNADNIKVTLLKATMADGKDPAEGETKYASLIDNVDFLINTFSARGHESYTEGVSLGFKSHYGTYINAPMSTIHATPGFSQRVRNLHCTGVISKKQVLSVSCAFYCNNEGDSMGSTGTKPFTTYVNKIDAAATCESPSTLIMSTDAVSCEMQAIKILRINKSKPYGINDMPKYLRASAGITGALTDTTYDIGEIDEAKMDIRKTINGASTTPLRSYSPPSASHPTALLKVTSFQHQRTTHFEYKLPASLQGCSAQLSVVDLTGKLVFSTGLTVNGILNHFSWNQKTARGATIGNGRYIAELTAGTTICRELFLIT